MYNSVNKTLEDIMLQKAGLVLSDGTSIDDLIDLKMHEVSLRVMNDPELHKIRSSSRGTARAMSMCRSMSARIAA